MSGSGQWPLTGYSLPLLSHRVSSGKQHECRKIRLIHRQGHPDSQIPESYFIQAVVLLYNVCASLSVSPCRCLAQRGTVHEDGRPRLILWILQVLASFYSDL